MIPQSSSSTTTTPLPVEIVASRDFLKWMGEQQISRLSHHHGVKCIFCYKILGGGLRRGAKITGLSSKPSPRLTHPTILEKTLKYNFLSV